MGHLPREDDSDSQGVLMPEAGKPLDIRDVYEIFEAVETRQKNFPGEPMSMTFLLILLNIGDRYSTVVCTQGEWTSIKKEIPKGEGIPTCPNGHPLTQTDGLTIGWLPVEKG